MRRGLGELRGPHPTGLLIPEVPRVMLILTGKVEYRIHGQATYRIVAAM